MSLPEASWLTKARDLIGLKEIKGAQHEPEILRLWQDAHLGHVKDDETAWCSAFICGTLERAGIVSTRAPNARSYEHWGTSVLESGPLMVPLGAVLVLSRPPIDWQGHVTYAVGFTSNGRILGLGGNQKDSVSIADFEPWRVIAARWPAEDRTDFRLLRRIPLLGSSGSVSTGEA